MTRPIPFQRLVQGDSLTAGLAQPAVVVLSTTEAAQQLAELLNDPGVSASVGAAASDQAALVVAVFRGRVGSSGYTITVRSVEEVGETVRLTVELADPQPGQAVSDVISYPYDIITLARDDLSAAPQRAWAVYTTDGSLLAETGS